MADVVIVAPVVYGISKPCLIRAVSPSVVKIFGADSTFDFPTVCNADNLISKKFCDPPNIKPKEKPPRVDIGKSTAYL
ncbi:MAG: hypothetical protein ACP5RD_08280, partial [bacterium]